MPWRLVCVAFLAVLGGVWGLRTRDLASSRNPLRLRESERVRNGVVLQGCAPLPCAPRPLMGCRLLDVCGFFARAPRGLAVASAV